MTFRCGTSSLLGHLLRVHNCDSGDSELLNMTDAPITAWQSKDAEEADDIEAQYDKLAAVNDAKRKALMQILPVLPTRPVRCRCSGHVAPPKTSGRSARLRALAL